MLFGGLDAALIRFIALEISGAAGPLDVNAHMYSWMLYCTSFGSTSVDLCHMPFQLMAIEYVHHNVDPSDPAAYVACHLFPLDKNPGVCTIGVNEALRRIIWKAVMRIGR